MGPNVPPKRFNLAILSTHPTQYHAPLYKHFAMHPELNVTVYYCFDDMHERVDPGFGLKIKWDIPLLEGYIYQFLPGIREKRFLRFFRAVVLSLRVNSYTAIMVHSYTAPTSLLAFLSAWLTKTPILVLSPTEPFAYRSRVKQIVKHLILRPLFKGIDAFLADCSLNKKSYQKFNVPENKIFMVPSAVDNDRFQSIAREMRSKKFTQKAEFGLDQDIPVILFANKLIHRKRPFDLLKAYEMVTDHYKSYLIFVGDGPERVRLESYVRRNCIDNVRFTGFKNQSDIPLFYSIADVFVLPSMDDASPKSLNEAMNFSLPVIVTDGVGTAPELVQHGENGFIYKRSDIDGLSECLRKVLSDPEGAKCMGKRSLEIVSNYDFIADIEGTLSALYYVRKVKSNNENQEECV